MNRTSPDTQLIQIQTPEASEIERQLTELHKKQDQVAEFTLSLEDLKLEVRRFETEYNAIIGKLYVELDKVNLEIEEYTLRVQLAEQEMITDSAEIDEQIQQSFAEQRQKVEAYEKETAQDSEIFEAMQSEPETDAATIKHLRKLYLKLAKIYHPDKARTDKEREKNERMMSLINRAYEEKDVLTLQRLADGAREEEEKFLNETPEEKRQRLRTENQRLDEIIANLKKEVDTIKAGATYKLKTTVERARKQGEDILTKMATDMRRKIDSARQKLNGLIQRFRRFADLLHI